MYSASRQTTASLQQDGALVQFIFAEGALKHWLTLNGWADFASSRVDQRIGSERPKSGRPDDQRIDLCLNDKPTLGEAEHGKAFSRI